MREFYEWSGCKALVGKVLNSLMIFIYGAGTVRCAL